MKILIIYGTNTGNTKELVDFIHTELQQDNIDCEIINCVNIKSPYSFPKDFDVVILSSPTWGGIPSGLQDDFENFWSCFLNKDSIKNIKFALIGLGDDYYQYFCEALNILERELEKYKGKLVVPQLPICDPWQNSTNEIKKWLKNLKNSII